MKILQLVNRIPYPLNDGGNLAVNFYTEGFLKAGVSLSMLAMNTTRHWVDEKKLPQQFLSLKHFETVKVDNRIRPIPALLNLMSSKSYNIARFISKDFEKALIKMLQKENFDIIQLEGLFLMPYISIIRQYSKAKVVLRQHNAEFLIWERLAQQAKKGIKKQYLQLLAKRLKRFEQKSLNQIDFLLPISQHDAKIFKAMGATKPMLVQSFGLDTEKILFSPQATMPISLYHIGAMDWQPNLEGIQYFIDKVLPILVQDKPEIKLHLAGRNMPDFFQKIKNKNIIVHGEVPDASAFEQDKSILIVPLLSGGGVRIKIFKAMAMGKAIVSTKVGMEGISIKNNREAIIVQNALEMANAIIGLINQPEKILTLGHNARKFIMTHFDQQMMIQELLACFEDLRGK